MPECFKKAVVTLTDAQIKALPSTPVQVIAAVTGKILFPVAAFLRSKWTADYSNIHSQSQIQFRLGGTDILNPLYQEQGSNVSALLAGGGPDGVNGWTAATSRSLPPGPVMGGLAGAYDSDVAGLPLSIQIENNGAGDLTGGNAANALTVVVAYLEISIA